MYQALKWAVAIFCTFFFFNVFYCQGKGSIEAVARYLLQRHDKLDLSSSWDGGTDPRKSIAGPTSPRGYNKGREGDGFEDWDTGNAQQFEAAKVRAEKKGVNYDEEDEVDYDQGLAEKGSVAPAKKSAKGKLMYYKLCIIRS